MFAVFLKDSDMIQEVRSLLCMASFIVKSRQQRVIRQTVTTCLQSKQELRLIAFFQSLFGISQFFCIKLSIAVFIKLFGQKVVLLTDSTVSIQVKSHTRDMLLLSLFLQFSLSPNLRSCRPRSMPIWWDLSSCRLLIELSSLQLFCRRHFIPIYREFWCDMLL